MRFTHLLRGTASIAVLAALATAAHAQDQTSPTTGQEVAVEEDEDANTVDEIVVTAQRREQSLQDVPVVVTALSEQLLEDTGVRDIKDLQILTPGLTVTSTTSESVTTARIRGVGTVGDNPGLESSVGVTIDGVYRPRNGVGFQDLGELQRIEVLKGPQGTLFGRNTSAGVINVITKEPEFEFGSEAELTFSNFGGVGGGASMTGPIVPDLLAGRLYVARRTRDGFYDVRTGEGPRTLTEDQDQDFVTIRGQLLLAPSSEVSVRMIADWSKRDEFCCAAVQIRQPAAGGVAPLMDALATDTGFANPARPYDRIAYSNRDTNQNIEDGGVSVEANVDLPWLGSTLTSITAVRRWDNVAGQDIDFSTVDVLYRPANGTFGSEFNTLSQELRLAGSTDRIDWLIGGFYVSEGLDRNDTYVYGADYEAFASNIIAGNVLGLATRPTNRGGLGLPLGPSTAPSNTTFISEVTAAPFGSNYPATGVSALDQYDQTTHSAALFTHNIVRLTDAFDVVVGLRYTMERKELISNYRSPNPGVGCAGLQAAAVPGSAAQTRLVTALIRRGVPAAAFANPAAAGALIRTAIGASCLIWANPLHNGRQTYQEIEENEWSGTAKATYRFNDDIMAYASYARGYKAGGFNLDRTQSATGQQRAASGIIPVDDTSFPAEKVDSYELGAKTTWLGGSLLLNATAFHQTFDNFQLNTFLGTSFIVESIPEVTSKGVDADMVWFSPIDGLTLQGGVTYADTKYGNFTAADLGSVDRFAPLSLLPGSRISFAPQWSGSLSGTYEREFGGLLARFNLGAKYVSSYNTGSDLLPAKEQEGFTMLNGRVALGPSDERWSIELWGQNLTDEEYMQVAFNAPLQGSAFPTNIPFYDPAFDNQTYNAFLGQPRTYGITLRVEY